MGRVNWFENDVQIFYPNAYHLLGALVWLLAVLWKSRRLAYTPGQDGLGLFATFWHFLGVLWVYLFLLLFVF